MHRMCAILGSFNGIVPTARAMTGEILNDLVSWCKGYHPSAVSLLPFNGEGTNTNGFPGKMLLLFIVVTTFLMGFRPLSA